MRAFRALRRTGQFTYVGRAGQRRASPTLIALVVRSHGPLTRVGFTVGKTVGGAVVRNRLRRRLKNALDTFDFDQMPVRDIVVIARPGAADLPFAAVVAQLRGLLA